MCETMANSIQVVVVTNKCVWASSLKYVLILVKLFTHHQINF